MSLDSSRATAGSRQLPSTAGPPGSSAGALFQYLRDGVPRTRGELVRASGMARSTVGDRLEELIDVGLISMTGEAASNGGRPAATFAFDPTRRVVVGIDLGVSHAHVSLTDLANQTLVDHLEDVAIADGPEQVLARVLGMADDLLARMMRDRNAVAGVGIGLPGPVEFSTGQPISPPVMPGWDRFDVPGFVRRHLDAPVLVDNDVNLMALGEHAERYPDVDDLVFVKVASGIGAGIISGGRLQRGARGAAGDLGHIALPGDAAALCRCGNRDCLEAVASGTAIVENLQAGGVRVKDIGDLVTLTRAGNTQVIQALRAAGRDIGTVLAGVVSLLNPSVIVVGGRMSAVGEHLLAGIREAVYARSLPLGTHHLRIASSTSGPDAGVVGASYLVTSRVLSVEAVNAHVGASPRA